MVLGGATRHLNFFKVEARLPKVEILSQEDDMEA